MKLVELFCGSGGFSLGAHNAGFHVATAYDNDETLTCSFQRNFPQTKLLHRDITKLSGVEIRDDTEGQIEGIFGGPPCQGFSAIGRRAKDDPRREPLHHFFRIVSEVEPLFFVMENVQGLAFPDALPILNEALALVENNYHILGPNIWNAADFGAATKRNRVFVVGMKRGSATPINQEAIYAFRRPAATVRDAIADLENARPLPECELFEGYDRWRISRRGRPSTYATTLRTKSKIFTGHRFTAHTQPVIKRFNSVKPGGTDSIGRHPRLKWSGLCPTLRAGTGADKGSYQSVRPIHPSENRVITVREAARLQGFPDAHIFHPTIWHSFRMIGNSVSPIIAKAIFSAIHSHLSNPKVALKTSADSMTDKTFTGTIPEAAE